MLDSATTKTIKFNPPSLEFFFPHHRFSSQNLIMKATFITFAAALGLASAQKAIVTNGCSSTFYVQSFPFDGSAPGPLTTVEAGKFFSESLRPSGSVGSLLIINGNCLLTVINQDREDFQDENAGYSAVLRLLIWFQPRLCLL
jgi:hypothetical protein